MSQQQLKIDGKKTVLGFSQALRLKNRSIEDAVQRLRGNQRTIARDLLYDFRNAVNHEGDRKSGPRTFALGGKLYLRTAPALIRERADWSFTTQTARNCLKALEAKGIVVKELRRMGNDTLVLIDQDLLEWYQPKPKNPQQQTPKEPPNETSRHSEGQGLTDGDIAKMAAKFNRKNHHR